MRLLDLFCGRWGWSRAFAARGWDVTGIDLCDLNDVDKPAGATFLCSDVLNFWATEGWIHRNATHACDWSEQFDFIVASPPCEEFSVFGMKCFHPNPPYPRFGIELFNHTRELCETSKIPYVIENVWPAAKFVGRWEHHAGPYFLWGNGVPPLMPGGIRKGKSFRGAPGAYMEKKPMNVSTKEWRNLYQQEAERLAGGRKNCASFAATIPPELANCVADYAERILEGRHAATQSV